MARGLGSSSACIVAGILGANRLLGTPFSQKDLVNFAAKIEGHPDNTTPAIEGGPGGVCHRGGAGLQRKRTGFR